MPAVTLNPITVRPGNTTANWTTTTITSAMVSDGVQVRYPKDGRLIIIVTNSAGSAKNVTVRAGSGPAASQGNIVRQLPATTGTWIIHPDPSARTKDGDGYVQLTLESGTTGTIAALAIE